MKTLNLVVLALFAAGTAAATTTTATTTHPKPHAHATVSRTAARRTALARVPGGTVKSGELEREKGKMVYSFDIAQKGKSGVEEVQIDARTGKFLSEKHETTKRETAEKAKDRKAPAQTKAKTG